jgi:hypothetical protein
VRSPYFLYPDEATVKGSTLAASCLLTTLLNENKIGLARFVRTSSSAPSLLALIPQKEVISKEGIQTAPPGFHAVVLPFRDDIRELPHINLTQTVRPEDDDDEEEEDVQVTTTSKDGLLVDSDDEGTKTISKKSGNSNPLSNRLYSTKLSKAVTRLVKDSVNIDKSALFDIPNPVLQKQWHMLQALAMDTAASSSSSSSLSASLSLPNASSSSASKTTWNEKRDDLLQPNRKAWNAKYHLSIGFMNALPFGGLTSGTSPKKKATASKRKPAGGGGGGGGDNVFDSDDESGGKKKRAKPTVTELTDDEWAVMAASGTLESQTIPNLKAYLKKHGQPVSGKKSDLVERVLDLLSSV